jgi:DNA-binding CsgD family transcriptional regulator
MMAIVGANRLFGRDRELAFLGSLVDGVRAGVGGAVLVEGEQGVGKSALLRAGLAAAADAGCTVWRGAADELVQAFPLQLVASCVSAEDPAAAWAYLDASERMLTGDPVSARIERLLSVVDHMCALTPVLLMAENLQWADEASVTVWRRLSRAVGQLPLLLAGSVRPGSGRGDLDRLRRDLIAHGGTVLTLGPLGGEEIGELVADVLGGTPGPRLGAMLRRAGGNPLYARELADAVVAEHRARVAGTVAELVDGPALLEVPASLAAVLTQRLRGLPADVMTVLRRAALLGLEFSVLDLEVLTGRTAGELMGVVEAGVTAGVLTEAGLRLGFRHALIRQLLYEEIPAAERPAAHLEAARSLAAAGAAPERVAAQLVLVVTPEPEPEAEALGAGPARAWVPQWLADSAGALTYRAPQVAAELLRTVLRQLPEADPRREQLEVSLVTVAFLLLRDDEVEATGARLLNRGRDHERMAEMAWLVAYARMRAGRPAQGVAAVDEALALAGLSELRTARLKALRAMILIVLGHFDEAARVAEAALAAAERVGDRLGTGYALHALSMVEFVRSDHQRRLGYIDRALPVTADDPQAADLRLMLLANKTSALELMDRQAEAIGTAQQALALAERVGTPRLRVIRTALGQLYVEVGRWDDALAELELVTGQPGPDYLHFLAGGLVALIAAHRDDWDEAARYLSAVGAEAITAVPSRANAHYMLLAQALAEEHAGRTGSAVAILAQCLEPSLAEGMPSRYQLLPPLVRLAVAAGDAAIAAAAAAAAAREAQAEGLPVKVAMADHCRGLATADPGPVLAAAGYFEATGRPLERAQALEDAAVLAAERGDVAAAGQALSRAITQYDSLGAQWDVRRATARLRQYGVRRGRGSYRSRPETGWGALTPTEVTVAYLVADGQSNPDIAAQLYLSRNTVQTHVSHILAKLGARSRAEIVREAAQHPGAEPAAQ